jgi:hypothetical protein
MSGGTQQLKEVKCARAVIGAQGIDGSGPGGPQGMRQYPGAGTEGLVNGCTGEERGAETSHPLGDRKDRVPRDGGAGRREQVLDRLLDTRHA